MKSVVCLWLVGLGVLVSHVGCCTVRMDGACGAGSGGIGGCDVGGCANAACDSGCGLPFSNIRHRLVNRIRTTNCASGCGEIYWDEQINEPPVCDPCGCDGQFIGQSCDGCPNALARLRQLWGYRYQPSSCDTCGSGGSLTSGRGCSSCGSGDVPTSHGPYARNATMPSTTYAQSEQATTNDVRRQVPASRNEPTPAAKPVREQSQQPSNIEFDEATTQLPNSARKALRPENQITIGSGVATERQVTNSQSRMTPAKQVSAKAAPRNRLVTNPGK